MLKVDGYELAAHIASEVDAPANSRQGLVLCHGFPAQRSLSIAFGETYPELADRLASDTGWSVLTFDFRGTGSSEGDFSLSGWLADLHGAIELLRTQPEVNGVWLAGFGTGGSLAIVAAAEDSEVYGVAAFGSPAHFDDWAADPERCLERARESGAVKTKDFPSDFKAWARDFSEIRAEDVVGKIPPRPVMLIHGSSDEVVMPEEVRLLADLTDAEAEVRIISGGAHDLRHDPRAIALLSGWMDRHRG